MDPENARRGLDAKLAEKGYVHPESSNWSKQPQYMSYSYTDEQKKKSDMGEYGSSSTNYDPYSTFNSEINTSESQRNNICPFCDQKAMYECNCDLNDMMCAKGHIWYITKKGEIQLGDPHK